MSASLTASLVLALLVFSFSVSAGQRNETAELGDNVTLTCRAAENKDVIVVEWSRTDLESDQYVLLYKDSQFDPDHQSPSFRNRVDLLDMKNGDVSLVLKNVTTADTGTYECRVIQRGNNHRKRSLQDTETISTIKLIVEAGNKEKQEVDGGNKGGPKENGGSKTGWIIGVSVFAVAVFVVVVGGAVFYKRPRDSSLKSKRPPAAADAEEMLTGPDE